MAATVLALLFAAQSPTATQSPLPPEKPRLICRKSERVTGSRIRTGRRCETAEEWTREDEERQRMSPSARVTEGQGDALTKSPPH